MNISGVSRELPVLIAGPTASGKSALAMHIAARDGRVIVNADALQVYDMWRILTARPGAAEEAALPHALFGHVHRDQPYSTGHWLREVAGLLGQPVVIVGGTGLNFRALTRGLADIPAIPAAVRAAANAALQTAGLAAMVAALDQATRGQIDTANPARVQRAWEVLMATGRGLAAWQQDTGAPLLPLAQATPLVLEMPAARLDLRIAQRFGQMMDEGALDEVRAALPHWPDAPHTGQPPPWSRAIGAAELVAYLRGRLTKDAACTAAILASRQYAKRQRTWFRSQMAAWQHIAL